MSHLTTLVDTVRRLGSEACMHDGPAPRSAVARSAVLEPLA